MKRVSITIHLEEKTFQDATVFAAKFDKELNELIEDYLKACSMASVAALSREDVTIGKAHSTSEEDKSEGNFDHQKEPATANIQDNRPKLDPMLLLLFPPRPDSEIGHKSNAELREDYYNYVANKGRAEEE